MRLRGPLYLLYTYLAASSAAHEDPVAALTLPDDLGPIPLIGLGTGFTDCFSTVDGTFAKDPLEQECGPPSEFYEKALDAGCRLFDTAFIYGSEKPLGTALQRWIQRGGRREDVFIISKTIPSEFLCGEAERLEEEGLFPEEGFENCFSGIQNVSHGIGVSLARLQTTYIDALLLHHPRYESKRSYSEQWRQMEAAVDAGKVRMLAVTSDPILWIPSTGPAGLHSGSEVLEFMRIRPKLVFDAFNRRAHGLWRFVWNQPLPTRQDHVEDKVLGRIESDPELLDFYKTSGISVFGGGLVNLEREHKEWINSNAVDEILHERKSQGEQVTARQVKLRFMCQSGSLGPGPLVPQTRDIGHLKENLGVLRMRPLSPAEIKRLMHGVSKILVEAESEWATSEAIVASLSSAVTEVLESVDEL